VLEIFQANGRVVFLVGVLFAATTLFYEYIERGVEIVSS
jgi:hypothetical protein